MRKIFSPKTHVGGTKTLVVKSNVQAEKPHIALESLELTEGVFKPAITKKVTFDMIVSKVENLRTLISQNQIEGLTFCEKKFLPSTSDEISEFEHKYEVILPEDFKEFLTKIGYYIFPYCKPEKVFYKLSEPYGINTEPVNPQPEWYVDANKQVISISDYGCGIYFVLSLFGNEHGNVWVYDQANTETACPIIPTNEGVERVSFLDWYNYWLDAALASIDRDLS